MINFPPFIEGTIPAFTSSGGIKVPFIQNPAVSKEQVTGFRLLIKDLDSNIITRVVSTASETEKFFINNIVEFNVPISYLTKGNYYKIQLAYLDDDQYNTPEKTNTDIYSTVAISKYIAMPEIIITNGKGDQLNTNLGSPNTNLFEYIGKYSINDLSEPIVSYSFIMTDQYGKIIAESGEQIHNSETNQIDAIYLICQDSFNTYKDLEESKDYYIQYKVKTINGYEGASQKYLIRYSASIDIPISMNINPVLDYENGRIEVTLDIDTENSEQITGSFLFLRSDNKSNYTEWEQITTIPYGTYLNGFKWIDNTIESGVSYKYGLIQYNKYGISSNRLESEIIKAYFEHIFLSDENCQLKIKFNPEVSSFKNTILETKTDTIGGKYPFFFRNGIVNYKEFPINGLISYQMDDANTFIEKEEIGIVEPEKLSIFNENINTITTNLVDYNYSAEKEFKLKVLDWLTNGKPKLFRSAAEGNYIIRLMNVSLSPEQALGRMLHKFSSTAIECLDFTYSNLKSEGLIAQEINNINLPLQWKTIDLSNDMYYPILTPDNPSSWYWISVSDKGEHIVWAHFSGLFPGDKIIYGDTEITIGITGEYKVNVPIDGYIKVYNSNKKIGSVTYAYTEELKASDIELISLAVPQRILKTVIPEDNSGIMKLSSSILETKNQQFSEFYRLLFTLKKPVRYNTEGKILDEEGNILNEQEVNQVQQANQIHFYENDYDMMIPSNNSSPTTIDLSYSEKLDINLSNFDSNAILKEQLNLDDSLTKLITPGQIVIGSNVRVDCYYQIIDTTLEKGDSA